MPTSFSAQSTPQTYRSRQGVRRQSSVGPLNDTSPLTGGPAAGEPAVSTPAHSATLPVSSLSTNPSSYYTNASPSPPAAPSVHQHVSCDDILATPAPPSAARTPSCRSAPHSAVNLHQTGRPAALSFSNEKTQNAAAPQVHFTDFRDPFLLYFLLTYFFYLYFSLFRSKIWIQLDLSITYLLFIEFAIRNTSDIYFFIQDSISPQYQNVGTAASAASVATVLTRLDELSRRVAVLETGLTADVRRILQLLQARDVPTHHNAQPVHTPSTVLPKASLSVPQTNEVK